MIEIDKNSGVATITLARPEVRNALNDEVMDRIDAALVELRDDESVRAVVLTGAGKAFSAGADLNFMRKVATADREQNERDAMKMGGLFHRLAGFEKPVVARVNGPAMGGGVGLVVSCDIVVAAASAFFAFSEVRLGLVPAVISPFCVRRLGPAVARRLFLTGERLDAREAWRLGLVDEVVEDAELDAAVEKVTDMLKAGGPVALAEAKKLVDVVSGRPPQEALAYTAACIARLRASDEAQEGMRAFLEKRRPAWAAATD
ncbi:MAG: hypothetical protein D6760_09455 [Deltaproteobacteria bacterium]|nr:MAG: hypothetical protein D6760_09455 [Deltaproteobacteria bacterium]